MICASYQRVFQRNPESGEMDFRRGHAMGKGLLFKEVVREHQAHKAKEDLENARRKQEEARQKRAAVAAAAVSQAQPSPGITSLLQKNRASFDSQGNLLKNGQVVATFGHWRISGGNLIQDGGAYIFPKLITDNGAGIVGTNTARVVGQNGAGFSTRSRGR